MLIRLDIILDALLLPNSDHVTLARIRVPRSATLQTPCAHLSCLAAGSMPVLQGRQLPLGVRLAFHSGPI
jgi:hypothetical protein